MYFLDENNDSVSQVFRRYYGTRSLHPGSTHTFDTKHNRGRAWMVEQPCVPFHRVPTRVVNVLHDSLCTTQATHFAWQELVDPAPCAP